MSRKGFYFTIDAFLGATLLLIGLVALAATVNHTSHTEVLEHYSQDTLNALGSIKLQELYNANNTFIVQEYQNGSITSLNHSVLEQIGEYWALGNIPKAQQLIALTTAGAIPDRFGFSISAGTDTLYNRTVGTSSDLVTTRKMIAGIGAGKPITGSASSAYLRKIENKRTFSYVYFGGFVGQGNVTVFISSLPADVNASSITQMTIEGDTALPFNVRVNGILCNYSINATSSSSVFTPLGGANLTPSTWDISLCNSSLKTSASQNNFTLVFVGNLSDSYIAGGLIKVSYRTNTLIENYTSGKIVYNFPDITGLVNLFDSFYVPGTLTQIDASLHLSSNYSTYLTIGNADFIFNGSNQSFSVNVSNASIAARLNVKTLNYSALSMTTVPVRVGIGAVAPAITSTQTMLVTDTSGSMSGSYMDTNGFGRWTGYTSFLIVVTNLPANGEYNYTFNITDPGFAFDSIGANATGLSNGTVDLWVTPPNAAETRAQCDEAPSPCNAVDNDNDEYYYRDDPVNGTYKIRVRSSTAQNISVEILLSKVDAAKSADKLFAETLINASGPLVGLGEYSDAMKSGNNLTTNKTILFNQINGYAASGGTCICCGIMNATSELTKDGRFNLINRGDVWKYNSTDLAAAPANWTKLNFNDASWRSGSGAFGNGSGGYPPSITTVVKKYLGDYYFRKAFNVSNASSISDLTLYLYDDSGVQVFLNNVSVYNQLGTYDTAAYWSNGPLTINKSLLVNGQNIIAVELTNSKNCAKCKSDDGVGFDAQLSVSTSGNASGVVKTIVLMTDGQANVDCSSAMGSFAPDYNGDGDTTNDPVDQAIQSACDAYSKYGIIVDTVGFGADADQKTLQGMANLTCGHGQYYNASNVTALNNVFASLAQSVISNSGVQTLVALGSINNTRLYGDSTLTILYNPVIAPPTPNELSVTIQSPPLGGCNSTISLPPGVRISDAQLTSYSGPYWSDTLFVNGQSVYNLSQYGLAYNNLGDPFIIHVPPSLLSVGASNTIALSIGQDQANHTACSLNNTLIYTALVNSSTARSGVYANAIGCNWTVQFADGSLGNIVVPTTYAGNNSCSYTNASISYKSNDAYDVALFNLFRQLDFNNDGHVLVNIGSQDLEIIVTLVGQVPYLWGPSLIEFKVWK